MVGYCMKDQGQPHFRFETKNVSDEVNILIFKLFFFITLSRRIVGKSYFVIAGDSERER